MPNRRISAEAAAALVSDADTLTTSGFVGIGVPETLLKALAGRFAETGAPKGLTLLFAAGQGDGRDRGLNHLARDGLLARAIGGHWGADPRITEASGFQSTSQSYRFGAACGLPPKGPRNVRTMPTVDGHQQDGTVTMSLKRILGTMLASRLAGRGRRRGSLGTASMLGIGRRRRGIGGKMGVAALGYMAYRAYQDHQARTAGSGGGAASSGSTQGGLGGLIQGVADRLSGGGATTGGGSAQAQGGATPEHQEEERAAEQFSDETALLLIRAMITAAYSDGALSEGERGRIMKEIEDADADAEDRRVMEREIANPRPLDELLGQVHDEETAQEFYLASRAAVDGETEQNRTYLRNLRERLGLSEEDAAEVEEIAS